MRREYFPLRASEEDGDSDRLPYLESVIWTPTGNGVAYVYKNNIYYKPRIKKPQIYTVTRDGEEEFYFNGRPDFLYENKILDTGTALWFSPDSSMLAFASFNSSSVGKLQFPFYGNSVSFRRRKVCFSLLKFM